MCFLIKWKDESDGYLFWSFDYVAVGKVLEDKKGDWNNIIVVDNT